MLKFQRPCFKTGRMIVLDMVPVEGSEELVQKPIMLKPSDSGKELEFHSEDFVLGGKLGVFFEKV